MIALRVQVVAITKPDHGQAKDQRNQYNSRQAKAHAMSLFLRNGDQSPPEIDIRAREIRENICP